MLKRGLPADSWRIARSIASVFPDKEYRYVASLSGRGSGSLPVRRRLARRGRRGRESDERRSEGESRRQGKGIQARQENPYSRRGRQGNQGRQGPRRETEEGRQSRNRGRWRQGQGNQHQEVVAI